MNKINNSEKLELRHKFLFLNNKIVILNNFFFKIFLINKKIKFLNFFKISNKNVWFFPFKNKKMVKLFFYKQKTLNKKLLFIFCSYCYTKIFLKVGLGFRKKYSKKFNAYFLNIGIRKWIIFKTFPSTFFFNIKRRNIFMFSNTKKKLYYYITHLRYARNETVYKVKGIMTLNRIKFNRKISRSIIFARRVKFKKMKLKLTKKQKQRK